MLSKILIQIQFLNKFLQFWLISLVSVLNVFADANPDIWPYLKAQVFKDRAIEENQSFLGLRLTFDGLLIGSGRII